MLAKKRISFLATGLNYAGGETQLVNLATRLKARGWDVQVISMLPPKAYTEELAAAGIQLDTLGMNRGMPDPRSLLRLAELLRGWQPSVLHSHMVHANLLARVTRPLHHVPVIVSTAHNINERRELATQQDVNKGARWREIAYRLTDPFCDLTTNVSQAAVDRYVRIGAAPARKISFVPNGVDTQQFRPDAQAREQLRRSLQLGGRFAWIAVSRFEEAKDHATMLKAFSMLTKQRPEATLLLVGQGTLQEATANLVEQLGLSEKVRFLGVRRDVADLMNAADAYVMSSAWEGMPIVLMEAGAVGLPIVATDVGGNREVVLPERSAFLAPMRAPQELSAAMERLMSLPTAERKQMGAFGHVFIETHYSLDTVVSRWEAIYNELWESKIPALPAQI